MSPEPLRREPGPRDWSPATGFGDAPPPPRTPRPFAWAGPEPPSRGRTPTSTTASDRRAPWIALLAALLVLAGAFFPQRGALGLVGSIALGIIIVVGAVQARRLYYAGRTRFIAPSTAALLLASIATTSLGLSLASVLTDVPLPHLAVATEMIRDQRTASAVQPPAAIQPTPALPAAPSGEAPVEPLLSVTFESAADEQRHLIQELGTVQFLIAEHYPTAPPASVYVSPTGYTHATPEGAIMMAAPAGVEGWYTVLPDQSGYVIELAGTQFGSRATFDSRSGQITLN